MEKPHFDEMAAMLNGIKPIGITGEGLKIAGQLHAFPTEIKSKFESRLIAGELTLRQALVIARSEANGEQCRTE